MEVRGGPEEGPEGAAAEVHRRARQGPAESRSGGRSGAGLGEPGLGFRASPERADQSRQPRPAGGGGRRQAVCWARSPRIGAPFRSAEVGPGWPSELQKRGDGGCARAASSRIPPRTLETRSRAPHPLTPCAPARALRRALLQPSQTPTAQAPRRPLGSASAEGLAGAQGAGPAPTSIP